LVDQSEESECGSGCPPSVSRIHRQRLFITCSLGGSWKPDPPKIGRPMGHLHKSFKHRACHPDERPLSWEKLLLSKFCGYRHSGLGRENSCPTKFWLASPWDKAIFRDRARQGDVGMACHIAQRRVLWIMNLRIIHEIPSHPAVWGGIERPGSPYRGLHRYLHEP